MKPKKFQPMLGEKAPDDLSLLKYPVLVSPKLDGIRCVIRDGVALSRKLKPIPNQFVQSVLSCLPDGLDGELIVGSATTTDVRNRTQSGVMSADGKPDFMFHVFDWYYGDQSIPFNVRHASLLQAFGPRVTIVKHRWAHSVADLMKQEASYVDVGYEGLMVRDPEGPYKFGRSTAKEGGLLKVKRFFDAEAMVVDSVEQMHNANEKTEDERGYAKRSSHKENKIGKGTLGALVCRAILREDRKGFKNTPCEFTQDVEFELGTGFDDAQRQAIWDNRDDWIGRLVTFKYQQMGPNNKPVFPVFLGERAEIDA